MRRFRFRLQPLLRLRTQFERTSRRELAAAMGELAQVEQRLAAAAQGVRDCAEQGARPDAVGQLAKALESGLRRHQWRLQKQQRTAAQKVDGARAEYLQKVRDLRTLARLRERQHEQWRHDAMRAEQAELDELAALARSARAADATQGDVR